MSSSPILSWIRRTERRAPSWVRRVLRRPRALMRLARSTRSRTTWAGEYDEGIWDRLGGLKELSRYSVIAGYVRHLGGSPRVLDLGCGDGIMAQTMQVGTYVGCDFTLAAVSRARRRKLRRASFMVADASHPPFSPDSFDIVICNEVLYYVEDLPECLTGIRRLMRPEGHLIVSMFDAWGRPQGESWDPLKELFVVEDMVAVTTLRAQQTWRIALLRPRSVSDAPLPFA